MKKQKSVGKGTIDYRKLTIILLIIAILARFCLAFLSTVSGDACWHLSAARFIAEEGRIPLDEPFWAPPLFHLIAAGFYAAFGNFGLKLVSPIFGSACLIMEYLILKRFLKERALFFAMLFFSFLPLMIDYSILGYGESVLTFFLLLALYCAFEGRFLLSGVAAGLAILTKYNGVVVIPALIAIVWLHSKKNERWKNAAMVCIVPMLIASPWFLRNYLALGNPIWPFLNFLFPAAIEEAYSQISILALFSSQAWVSLYLGFFGVPDGNFRSLMFLDIPFFWFLFGAFIFATIAFLTPLFFGLRKRKGDWAWYVLLGSFFLLFLLYVANVGPFVSRMLMPAIIALAVFYGRGAERLLKRKRHAVPEHWMLAGVILLCMGFLLALFGKFLFASQAWGFYQEDFNWVKGNTPKDAVFLAGGQCMGFHIERISVFPSEMEKGEYQYVWTNQNFNLDRRSILTPEELGKLDFIPLERVYRNEKTGTAIYTKEG